MASIFLINDNKIVSRLLQLSSEKHGYLLEEKMELSPSKDHYDFVLIDSDKYSPELLEELKEKISFHKLGYIGIKKEQVPDAFDMHLDKPFLPSDFVSMIEENMQTIAAAPEMEEETVPAETVALDEEELLLDLEEDEDTTSVDELLEKTEENIDEETEEELEALNELNELEGLEDFSFDELEDSTSEESLTKATEIEDTGLKDLNKTEDALKELDALDEEMENVDLSLDTSSVMSTGVAEQFVDELPKADDEAQKVSDTAAATAVGAALAAATATAAVTGDKEEEKSLQKEQPKEEATETLTELDTLESGEDIEHESDYLKEDITTENLAEEFDTLNEKEVMKALSEEAKEAETEEIVHEEIISEGEETMVESNDVEAWIRDAVAKAITPEMIQEALKDMEVTVTLNFTKKDNTENVG